MANSESNDADGSAKDSPSLGEHLRSEREARSLTTAQVAQHLHLDVWIVEAMEANNFSALGAPVFAKGHLRQYAGMLGLASDDLMLEYYQAQDKPDQPPLIARYHPPLVADYQPHRRSNMRWLGWLLLIIVLMVAGLFLFQRFVGSAQQPRSISSVLEKTPVVSQLPLSGGATKEPAVESTPALPTSTQEIVAPDEPASTDERAQESLVPGAVPVIAQAEAAVPDPQPMSISLFFERESWAEVYGADRKRLMYDMGAENSTRKFSAVPPVQVFLGFASGVQIEVNGRPYVLSALEQRDNTARFRIEGERP